MKHVKFKIGKVVRDHPSGETDPHVDIKWKPLTLDEKKTHLRAKILEEAAEVAEASTREELIAEMADVLEVIEGLQKLENISQEEVLVYKQQKKENMGGFDLVRYQEYVAMPEDHRLCLHLKKSPEKYPELPLEGDEV